MRTLILAVLLWTTPVLAQTPAVQVASSVSAESCHLFLNRPGVVYSVAVATGASAGFLMLFDQATLPSNGAVVPILASFPVAATSGVYYPIYAPIRVGNGFVTCFSTTGQFTLTLSATAQFSAQVQ
jgi:hypothetical protein